MAIIKYSISDLRDYSKKLTNEVESMSNALNNLNNLNTSIGTHWIGNDQKAYSATFTTKTTGLKAYLDMVQEISTNLNTAAEKYQSHEEEFDKALW